MPSPLVQDYFQLFGLPESYEVDTAILMQRYRELQHSTHPDRFASASEQEQRLSVQLAAHINEAYQTLKHPLHRARYLLEQRGIDPVRQAPALDSDFLMEQMELRERIDSLGNQTDGLTALIDVRDGLVNRLRDLQQQFARLISSHDSEETGLAHADFNKMQFLYRLLDEIDVLEEQMLE